MRAGRIKGYAVTAKSRLASAPDIPTANEAGLWGFDVSSWHAVWAPKGTPKGIIDKLNSAVVHALADAAVQRLAELEQENPGARSADARGARAVPKGRDREMAADHQSGGHTRTIGSIVGPAAAERDLDSMGVQGSTRRIQGYCGLCVARCGYVAVVEDGRFVALQPDPTHPTGQALCAKGRAAPELVYHSDRLTHPLKRTRPKGDRDPEWQQIEWDEALNLTAAAIRRIAKRHGPEAVAFSMASPSTSAIADSLWWIRRLMNAFGTPNASTNLDVCGWGRSFATRYTYGVGSVASGVGGAMADIPNSGCLILWGYNPSIARLTHATIIIEALKRGLRLIVVDPRHAPFRLAVLDGKITQ